MYLRYIFSLLAPAPLIFAQVAEALVLQGGQGTFKTRPRVAVAAYHTPVQAMEVSTCLTKMGYQPGIEYARSGVYRAMQDHVPIIYGGVSGRGGLGPGLLGGL